MKKIIVGVLFIGIVIGGYLVNKIFTSNTKFSKEEIVLYIPTGSTYVDVQKMLVPYIEDQSKVDWVAEKRDYTQNVKSGKFILKKGMSSFSIIRALRHNNPVNVSFNNQETVDKLFERLDEQLEPSKSDLMKTFNNEAFLKENGLTPETLLTFFIPNSYEFYWNITTDELAEKLKKEHKKFWNENRLSKAKERNLTPSEVYTLASIVHKETAKSDERPKVAGVYLNRLGSNMPLQADPTVIYALKKNANDFNLVIKQVFFKDLITISPYNTYKNKGLPPGPIFMPDVNAIDAVLTPEKHNYLFFCASVEKFGYHEFAETYEEHQVIAKKYSEWVDKQEYTR